MQKLISCCGLNCANCEARMATINNDNELRAKTAEKWKVEYGAPNITPEMINCTGCRMEGEKIGHHAECKIQQCVNEKGFETCGECNEMDTCQLVSFVHKAVPEAITNLKKLK